MATDRGADFFKKLAHSICSERQLAVAQKRARDAAASELLALQARLLRLQKYEHLEPCDDGTIKLKRDTARLSGTYLDVEHLVSPSHGTLAVPIQRYTDS